MATTLSLVNEILRHAGQEEANTLTNARAPVAQTLDFLNQVYFEMLQILKVNRLQKSATITTQSGTNNYSPAADADINAILADSVILEEDEHRLMPVDYTYPLKHGLNASGKPRAFYIKGDEMILYPTPDEAYTIGYDYLIKPQKLTGDADEPTLPDDWERVLVQGTLSLLEKFLGEDHYRETYVLYRDGLARLKRRASVKPYYRMLGFYRGSGQS